MNMRLVISYSVSDGCTYSCDIVLPVEYESAEAFYCDFEAKVNDYIKRRDEYDAAYKIWHDNLMQRRKLCQNASGKEKKARENEYAELYVQPPQSPDTEFKLAGYDFDCSDFMSSGKVDMPTIQTVDEWFESRG